MEEQIKSNTPQMQETYQNSENQAAESSTAPVYGPVCRACGSPDIEEGYGFELCADCRTQLSGTKLPKWVIGFGLLVLFVTIFSMVKFPSGLQKGILLARAENSEAAGNYSSAMKYYTQLAEVYPDSDTVNAGLYASQYYCEKYSAALTTFDKLRESDSDDSVLVAKINSITRKINMYISPDEDASALLERIKDYDIDRRIAALKDYYEAHTDNIFIRLCLASAYREAQNYKEAESITLELAKQFPDFYDALFTLGAVYRESGKYDEAVATYRRILDINHENASAYSGIARIELLRKDNSKALELARKAYDIDPDDSFVLTNLVLAYHFNNMPEDRDKALEALEKSKPTESQLEFVKNVISSNSLIN